ncbi:hypothetical protein E4U42_000516 [Claviceps africana]|uniref:Uncharacterized protein n=1 Tax=Claviceps africana TaxID=83212 RepID=A0A8K0J009_9HYPO|nr:hypothetical protein E4U42_000516 [Claviceps africana]
MNKRLNVLSDRDHLEHIGLGYCGSVWGPLRLESEGEKGVPIDGNVGVVIKRENAGPGRDIENEGSVQSQVFAYAAGGLLQQSLVPQCFGLMSRLDERWNRLLPLLSAGLERCRAMVAEKIGCVSSTHTAQKSTKNNSESPYLMGSVSIASLAYTLADSDTCIQNIEGPRFVDLRNFPIHSNQAEELHLPCERYAKAMAEVLAVLHWKVRTNGAGRLKRSRRGGCIGPSRTIRHLNARL